MLMPAPCVQRPRRSLIMNFRAAGRKTRNTRFYRPEKQYSWGSPWLLGQRRRVLILRGGAKNAGHLSSSRPRRVSHRSLRALSVLRLPASATDARAICYRVTASAPHRRRAAWRYPQLVPAAGFRKRCLMQPSPSLWLCRPRRRRAPRTKACGGPHTASARPASNLPGRPMRQQSCAAAHTHVDPYSMRQ